MDFLEIKTIKHQLFALVEKDNKYFLFTGKILDPKMEIHDDTKDIFSGFYDYKISNYIVSRTAAINLTFAEHNDALFHLITLHNKEEYKTILEVAEVIL